MATTLTVPTMDPILLARAQELVHVGVWMWDAETGITHWSDEAFRLFGLEPQSIVLDQNTFISLVHPDDRERVGSAFGRAMQTRQPYEFDYRVILPSGELRVIGSRGSVDCDAQGQVIRLLGTAMDITPRAKEQEALRLQSELLQKIMDNLPVMVSMFDSEGRPVYLNRSWQTTFGWTLEAARATDVMAAQYPDPSEAARARSAIAECNGRWMDFEPRARDGKPVPSSWAGIQLSDGTKLTIGRDISERRAMEQRLVQSQRMEALGQLAGGVAHDFNNILTVIIACTTFIQEAAAGQTRILGDAAQIEEACKRAEALTRQLLAFSRRQMLKPELVDVNAAVKNVSRTLQRLIGENIELAVVPTAASPTIEVDAHQLEQVILNLAVNARDAIRANGTITIETANARRGAGHRELVVVSVSDDGEGIPDHVRTRMFEPFFTTKAVGKGTGLGLATVHGIVEQSGGFIEVESVVGKGSTFRVFLPAVAAAPVSRSTNDVRANVRGTETVLLVEDENAVRAIARRFLTALGYTVLEARHGADAMTVSQSHHGPIHALVTDVIMPEMDGRELAREIRKQRPGLPILYVSGYTEDELLRRGILEEGADLLRKPFPPLELARAVRRLVTVGQET